MENNRPKYDKENGFAMEARATRERVGSGVKFFSGSPVQLLSFRNIELTNTQLRDVTHVWRPEETLKAAQILGEAGKVLIRGEPQSGKGSILYGISSVCDLEGWGYVFIDGHIQQAPPDFIADVLFRANQEGKVIFYDSFDYLFANGKLRRGRCEDQLERVRIITRSLRGLSVPIALTMHDEVWSGRLLDQDMLSEFKDFVDSLPVYNLPMELESKASAAKFLTDHGFDERVTYQLLNLPENPGFIDFVALHYGDKVVVDQVSHALANYNVLKLAARESDDEIKMLLAQASGGSCGAMSKLVALLISFDKITAFLPIIRKGR